MTSNNDAAIRVTGLEKSFKDLHVLRGVDFDVAPGSIFALLGSNGAGKTTVIRILSTLLKQDAGTASVNGYDVATQAQNVRESISLTGQFAAVDEILSGRENLVLVAQLRHLKNPGKIADDLLARFALTEAGGRKASTYSGGMRRRLDIAMSLIGNPPVIFLDEPTTGLDPQGRIEVWQTVKELADSGTTVLLTTQYLDEAEQLADRIAILHQGRIIVNGTLAELKQLLPPAKVEYVEKQPSLEDVFLALVGDDSESVGATPPARGKRGTMMTTTHFFGDTAVLTGRSLRHILRSPDTIITTAVTPVALMVLFVFVFGGAIDTGVVLVHRLHAARHPAHHDRVGHRVHRLPALPGSAGRDLRAVPVDADRTVELAVGARADLTRREPGVARDRRRGRAAPGLPHRHERAGVAGRSRHPDPVHPGPDLDRRDRRACRPRRWTARARSRTRSSSCRSSARRSCPPTRCPPRWHGSPRTSR